MENLQIIETGIYQHYKGGLYMVEGSVYDVDSEEHKVLYRNSDGVLFSRSLKEFTGSNAEGIKRFTKKGG